MRRILAKWISSSRLNLTLSVILRYFIHINLRKMIWLYKISNTEPIQYLHILQKNSIQYHFIQFGSHTSRTPSRTPISHAHHADFGQLPKTKNCQFLFSKIQKISKNRAWLPKGLFSHTGFGRPVTHHAACRIERNGTVNPLRNASKMCTVQVTHVVHATGQMYSNIIY